LSGNNASSNDRYGIYLSNSSNNTLSRNNASNNSEFGIYLDYSSNNTINGNNVSSNNYASYWLGGGISLSDSSNNTINGNNASNNVDGIYLYSSSNNMLSGNNANSNIYNNIILYLSSNNTLSGNNASSSNSNYEYGIYMGNSSNNTLSGNNASNNYYGIYLDYSSNNTLSGNNASNNSDFGIYLDYSSNNTLNGNNVSSNNYGSYWLGGGIYLSNSNDSKIYNNNFNNINNFYIYNSNINAWNITKFTLNSGINVVGGPHLGGNFWANQNGTGFSQTCTDADRDGICDAQYTLDSNNIDYLPLATYTATTPTESIPPVINSVELNTTVPNTGDAILITVNATDNVEVTGVMANSIALTVQGGNTLTWSGTITALKGTHSVNVSATDAENNVAWNNSTRYTATTPSTDSIPPVINSVELNTTVPNTGDAILITVNATDSVGVTSVVANGASLTVQGGNTITWSGTITAIEGIHSVNVSARDAADNVAWNNSTSYTAISGPIPPVPELSTVILTLTGIFGILLVSRKYQRT
jgi:parallel beta-helix repeat protein